MMISKCCNADALQYANAKGEVELDCGKCGKSCDAATDLKFVPEARHSAPVRVPKNGGEGPGDARKGRGPSSW
jgi:hypothetical protein